MYRHKTFIQQIQQAHMCIVYHCIVESKCVTSHQLSRRFNKTEHSDNE